MYADDTGLNERFLQMLPDGEGYFAVRQYWSLHKYIQQTEFYRLIADEPLLQAFHDMDRAMFWICKEASKDLEYNRRILHSVKIWLKVNTQYESANPVAPNFKSFETELGRSWTTVGEYPLNEIKWDDPYKPYREALRVLADHVLSGHAHVIRKESGFVLSRIINCHLKILKFNRFSVPATSKAPCFKESNCKCAQLRRAVFRIRSHFGA